MPRYNVQHPKTKQWACYSSNVGDFITEWMDEDKYDLWRRKQYGIYYCPITETMQKAYEEVMRMRITNKRDYERLLQCLKCEKDPAKCGVTEKQEDKNGMCTLYIENPKYIEWKEKHGYRR